jgi:MtrB/PioB family decaheme-associated outer membrane protein
MKTTSAYNFALTAIASGLLLAFGPVHAQDSDEIAKLISPESSISVGAGHVGDEARRLNEYTGKNTGGSYFIGEADINIRDDATGTWWRLKGRNLGEDNRDLRVEYEKQGDLALFLEYGELTHYDPITFNTALTGAGTYSQTVHAEGSPTSEYESQITRKNTKLGIDKILNKALSVQLRFRNEDKDGSRNMGFYDVGSHLAFVTEPLHQNTKEIEATVNYAGENLLLSTGYFGSFFTNDNNHFALNGAVGAYSQSIDSNMSLAQDNESHSVFVSGNYKFTNTTRAVFKVAYTEGRQNNDFYGALRSGLDNRTLDGKVDTTAVTLGLSSHPTSRLSLNANFRYEDRDDKTPQIRYFNVTPSYTGSGYNFDTSRKNTTAKLDGTYRLPMLLSLVGGLEWAKTTRAMPVARSLNWRRTTDEWTARLGVRRSLADNLNGSISLVHSDRNGDDYVPTTTYAKGFSDFYSGGATTITPSFINPIHWADRKRDKVKANLDWTPLEALSLQFTAQSAWDRYGAYNGSLGNDKGRAMLYSADANYALSEESNLTAWVSRDDTHMSQKTNMAYVNNVAQSPWSVDLGNLGKAAGVGANFKPMEKLRVDVEYQWSLDHNDYGMQGNGVTSVPTVSTRHATLKLSGDYAYRRNMGFKVQYVHDRFNSNDWTWAGESMYGDGTTANPHLIQSVNSIGVFMYFKWI